MEFINFSTTANSNLCANCLHDQHFLESSAINTNLATLRVLLPLSHVCKCEKGISGVAGLLESAASGSLLDYTETATSAEICFAKEHIGVVARTETDQLPVGTDRTGEAVPLLRAAGPNIGVGDLRQQHKGSQKLPRQCVPGLGLAASLHVLLEEVPQQGGWTFRVRRLVGRKAAEVPWQGGASHGLPNSGQHFGIQQLRPEQPLSPAADTSEQQKVSIEGSSEGSNGGSKLGSTCIS